MNQAKNNLQIAIEDSFIEAHIGNQVRSSGRTDKLHTAIKDYCQTQSSLAWEIEKKVESRAGSFSLDLYSESESIAFSFFWKRASASSVGGLRFGRFLTSISRFLYFGLLVIFYM